MIQLQNRSYRYEKITVLKTSKRGHIKKKYYRSFKNSENEIVESENIVKIV